MKLSVKIILYYIILILAVVVVYCLAGCSTTNKGKAVTRTHTDSSSVTRIDNSVAKTVDSISVKKDNTVTTTEKQDDYERETTIEFSRDFLTREKIDSAVKSGQPFVTGWIVADDYFPPVQKITIKEKGVKKEKSVVVLDKSDSSRSVTTEKTDLTKIVNTNLIKTETVKNKTVERKSYWGYLWFLLIPAIWLVGWYFGLWPLIPKRREKEEYPVTYKSKTK